MNTDKDALGKLQAEHCQRVFALYEARHGKFQKMFASLISFGLLFFLLVMLPYASTEMERVELEQSLENLPKEVEKLADKAESYQKAIEGIDGLQKSIKQMPRHLREFLLNIPRTASSSQPIVQVENTDDQTEQAPATKASEPCSQKEEDSKEWLSCKVRQEVLRQLKSIGNDLKADVFPHMPEKHQRLAEALQKLSQDFEQKLQQKPQFWTSYSGKVRFFRLDPEVENIFQTFAQTAKKEAQSIQAALEISEKRLVQQKKRQKKLQQQQQQIKERLESIESPIGKLPIGFTEAILIFPCLLAIFFFIYSHLFCESARLRGTFKRLYQAKDSEKILLKDEQIALIAPLWIDPANPEQNRLIQSGIFLSPVLMFIVACVQIIYLWQMPETFELSSQLNRQVYSVLYVLCILLILFSLSRVYKAVFKQAGAS